MKLVTAAIIERRNRVLLARRPPGDRHAGKWEFPGGKVEPGEEAGETIVREIREELSLDTEVIDRFAETTHRYPGGSIRLVAFRLRWVGGQITLSAHDATAWATPADILAYDLLPADVPIARSWSASAQIRSLPSPGT